MPWNSRIVIVYINRHKTDLAFCNHVGSALGNESASWESNKMNYPNIIALPVNHLSFLSCYAIVVSFFRQVMYGGNKRRSMLEANKGISMWK